MNTLPSGDTPDAPRRLVDPAQPAAAQDTERLPAAALRVGDEVLRRFGLGRPLRLEPVSAGFLNQNLRAVTARGSYFLKGYRYAQTLPVVREHELIARAVAAGVPAVAPLPAPSGATFLRVGGRLWAVFPYIEAQQIEPEGATPAHAWSMGEMLGRIHTALARLPEADVARFPAGAPWNSDRTAAEIAEYEAEICRRPVLDPFDQHALASFAYRRTLLAKGLPQPDAFGALPAQLLHGDYHHGNLFFNRTGQVAAVIDWELAAVRPRALEIMRTLDVALDLRGDLAAGGERLRAFVQAYASQEELTTEECIAMADIYSAFRVHSLWIYEEHYRKGSARTDRLAAGDILAIEWWLANRPALGERLVREMRRSPVRRLTR